MLERGNRVPVCLAVGCEPRLRGLPGFRQLALQRGLRRRGLGAGGAVRGQSGFELGVRRRHFSGLGVLRAQIGFELRMPRRHFGSGGALHIQIGLELGVSCRQLRGGGTLRAQIGLEFGTPRRRLGGGGALSGQGRTSSEALRARTPSSSRSNSASWTAPRGLGVGRGLARRALALKLACTLDPRLPRLVERGAEGLAFLLQPSRRGSFAFERGLFALDLAPETLNDRSLRIELAPQRIGGLAAGVDLIAQGY